MIHRPKNDFDSFEELFDQARESIEYWVEGAKNEFTEKVVRRMYEQGVSRSDLAQLLDKQPSQITKLLRGNNNFTICTMVQMADALGCHLHTHLEPHGYKTHWVDLFESVNVMSPSVPDKSEKGSDTHGDITTAA